VTGYQPGYCNIGRRQRRRRLRRGAVAFGGAAAYVVASLLGVVPSVLLVGVFVPLSFGFEWVIQAYTGFCVRLALLSRYDFTGSGGSTGSVTDATDRREDQLQAAKITAVAVVVAAVTTAVLVFLLG
jgi:hypothetical protein